MPHIHPDTPFTVYAPGATLWWHPRLTGWASWLKRHGWRWWLPRWAVRDCTARYPADVTCQCGMYSINWEHQYYGSENQD